MAAPHRGQALAVNHASVTSTLAVTREAVPTTDVTYRSHASKPHPPLI